MQIKFLIKCAAIGFLALLLLIPMVMIDGVIGERKSYRNDVINDIAKSSTGSQTVTPAIIVAPYKERTKQTDTIYNDGKKETVFVEKNVQKYKYFLPEELNISGHISTEERYRGIYKVPLYTADLKINGRFDIPKNFGITENLDKITFEKPYLVVGVEDTRGISNSVALKLKDKEIPFLPSTNTQISAQGIHAMLPDNHTQSRSLPFSIDLTLRGMKEIAFRPMGKTTQADITSPWKHPRFQGRFLPQTREIGEDGFTAHWETSFFASGMVQDVENCGQKRECYDLNTNTFGVSLLSGVDVYLQAERAIKYALLFVGLTFTAFFLFEILKGLRIHFVQYGLVGVALALFYLLLISLSEHIAFHLSYLAASTACVGLLAFYVSFVLRSMIRGVGFGAILAGLYGALYLLIRSEDYALLMGSALLFLVLGFIMVITRHVNWYNVEAAVKKQNSIAEEAAKGVL